MNAQQVLNFKRIEQALWYIQNNFTKQPSLDEVANHIHLSPFYFQKLFSEWAGTSPKKFLQYTTVAYAKSLLKNEQATLFDAAYQAGLSSTSRLHDLFVNIEGMTPAEYKKGGGKLEIHYCFYPSLFGNILMASTLKGICYMAFVGDDKHVAFLALKQQFPLAKFLKQSMPIHTEALAIFTGKESALPQIKLHLKGTDFQLKVWEALLKIPLGNVSTYGTIAQQINKPKASRAVGTAIGSNPIAFLIPCHRVIQASGALGGYMWGTARKAALIGWEAVQKEGL